jgi:hypothetical protein
MAAYDEFLQFPRNALAVIRVNFLFGSLCGVNSTHKEKLESILGRLINIVLKSKRYKVKDEHFLCFSNIRPGDSELVIYISSPARIFKERGFPVAGIEMVGGRGPPELKKL